MSSNGGTLFARTSENESRLSNRSINAAASDRTNRTPQKNGALNGATNRIAKSALRRAIGGTATGDAVCQLPKKRAALTGNETDSEESSGFGRLSNETPTKDELGELSGEMPESTHDGKEPNQSELKRIASNGRDELKEELREESKEPHEEFNEELNVASNIPRTSFDQTVQTKSIDQPSVCKASSERPKLLSEGKEFVENKRSDQPWSASSSERIKALDSVSSERSIGSLESATLSGKSCEASCEPSTNAFGECPSQPSSKWSSGELHECTSATACWFSGLVHENSSDRSSFKGNYRGGSSCERSSVGCTPFAEANGPEASRKSSANRLHSKSKLKMSCSLSANHFDLILIIQFLLLATSQHVHCQQQGGVFPSNQFK